MTTDQPQDPAQAHRRLEAQIDPLAKFLLEGNRAPKGDESACEGAVRVIAELETELADAKENEDAQQRTCIREMEKVDTLRLEAQEEEKQSSATDFDLDAHIEAVRSSPNPRPFEIPALPSQWEGITVAEAEELFANQTIDARGDNFTEHELIAVYRLAVEGGE